MQKKDTHTFTHIDICASGALTQYKDSHTLFQTRQAKKNFQASLRQRLLISQRNLSPFARSGAEAERKENTDTGTYKPYTNLWMISQVSR